MNLRQHSILYRNIKREVARTNPAKAGKLERILQDYHGDPAALNVFCLKFGSYNPWIAASNAMLKRTLFRTPKEIEREQIELGGSDTRRLKQQLFYLAHKYDPTRHWVSGAQAITKIMETFGTDEQKEQFSPEGRTKTRRRKKQRIQEGLEDLATTLEEALLGEKKAQSAEDRRKVQYIQGLDEELKKRLLLLDRVIYGDTAFNEGQSKTYLLSTDPGGMFFGWFKRQLTSLPAEIRDMYTSLTDDLTDPESEKELVASLIAYYANTRLISREIVLGGYQEDLDLILKLPEDHPLIQKHGRPNLAPIRDLLKQREITLLDATRVIQAYPVDAVRQEINSAYVREMEAEGHAILKIAENLFCPNGKWREDAYGVSLPMDRLKQSIYYAAWNRKDFAVIRNIIRARTIAKSRSGMMNALSMKQCKQLVDGVVIAVRKLKPLDEWIAQHKKKITSPETEYEAVKEARAVTIRGLAYDTAENFASQYGLTLDEFAKRGEAQFRSKALWQKMLPELQKSAAYGLYSTKLLERVAPFVAELRELVPQEQLVEHVTAALAAWHDPLTVESMLPLFPTIGKKYYTLPEAATIRAYAEAQRAIDALRAAKPEKINAVLEQREQLRKAQFHAGTLEPVIDVQAISYAQLDHALEPRIWFGEKAASILDVDQWDFFFAELTTGYYTGRQISGDWVKKFRFLTDAEAAPYLKQAGIANQLIQNTVTARRFDRDRDFVHTDLVQQVERVYQRISQQVVVDESIVISGAELLQQGNLLDTYALGITGTTRADANRFGYSFWECRWDLEQKNWQSRYDLPKYKVVVIIDRVRAYNERNKTELRVMAQRRLE